MRTIALALALFIYGAGFVPAGQTTFQIRVEIRNPVRIAVLESTAQVASVAGARLRGIAGEAGDTTQVFPAGGRQVLMLSVPRGDSATALYIPDGGVTDERAPDPSIQYSMILLQ
jgi:hypothetical protein